MHAVHPYKNAVEHIQLIGSFYFAVLVHPYKNAYYVVLFLSKILVLAQNVQSGHPQQNVLTTDRSIALGTRGVVLLRGPLAEEEFVWTPRQAVVRQAHHCAVLLDLPQLSRQGSAQIVALQHQPDERHPLFRGFLGCGTDGVPFGNAAGEPVPVERDRREPRHCAKAGWQPPSEPVAAQIQLHELARGSTVGSILDRVEPVGTQAQLLQRRVRERGARDRAGHRVASEVQHPQCGERGQRRGAERPGEGVVPGRDGPERRRQRPWRAERRPRQRVAAHVEVHQRAHRAQARQGPRERVVLQVEPRQGAQERQLRRYPSGEGVAGEVELLQRGGGGEQRRRYGAGEGVAGEVEDAEGRRQRDPRRERAVEPVVGEGQGREEGERGQKRRWERARVARGVERDGGDAEVGGVGGGRSVAADAARERRAGVAGEVPRREAGVGRDRGRGHGGPQRRERRLVARECGPGSGQRRVPEREQEKGQQR
jgi:hypothetical protein